MPEEKAIGLRKRIKSHELCLFVIDEVSTIDAYHIGMISIRLQQIMQVQEPFGGVAILFVGDFNQLPGVKKAFLIQQFCLLCNIPAIIVYYVN